MNLQNMKTQDLAQRLKTLDNISPRHKRLLLLVGLIGGVLVVAGSFLGNSPEPFAADKLMHFSAYGALAAVFVLALKLRWCIYPLIWLGLLSGLIEILQPLNTRSIDLGDAIANILGVLSGASIGLAIRFWYKSLKTEIDSVRPQKSVMTFPAGTTLVEEGQLLELLYTIHKGTVLLYKKQNGRQVAVKRLGEGEMFGLLPEILKVPQYTTVVAETSVQVYPIDYNILIRDNGGPKQPIGILITSMAEEIRKLSQTVSELRGPQEL